MKLETDKRNQNAKIIDIIQKQNKNHRSIIKALLEEVY